MSEIRFVPDLLDWRPGSGPSWRQRRRARRAVRALTAADHWRLEHGGTLTVVDGQR